MQIAENGFFSSKSHGDKKKKNGLAGLCTLPK